PQLTKEHLRFGHLSCYIHPFGCRLADEQAGLIPEFLQRVRLITPIGSYTVHLAFPCVLILWAQPVIRFSLSSSLIPFLFCFLALIGLAFFTGNTFIIFFYCPLQFIIEILSFLMLVLHVFIGYYLVTVSCIPIRRKRPLPGCMIVMKETAVVYRFLA